MHKLTKACAIPPKVKRIVEERDNGWCVLCGLPGKPEAHFIAKSRHGLGIPENIITLCRPCHDQYDFHDFDGTIERRLREYLEEYYPGFPDDQRIYNKWRSR